MKSKTITFEEVEYEIRSFGFFKANRILLGSILPVFKKVSTSIGGMKLGQQNTKEMIATIMSDLDADKVEDIMKKLLSNVYVDGVQLKGEDIDDFGLGIELLQESVILNYSSLGKLLRKLMEMLPEDDYEEEEENLSEEEETP